MIYKGKSAKFRSNEKETGKNSFSGKMKNSLIDPHPV